MIVKLDLLTLMEEHRLRVFENRVLWRIFGLKREVIGGSKKLHNEELLNLYSSPSIIRKHALPRKAMINLILLLPLA
jgi:hypothetical protein